MRYSTRSNLLAQKGAIVAPNYRGLEVIIDNDLGVWLERESDNGNGHYLGECYTRDNLVFDKLELTEREPYYGGVRYYTEGYPVAVIEKEYPTTMTETGADNLLATVPWDVAAREGVRVYVMGDRPY
jgi:hypothetical protein